MTHLQVFIYVSVHGVFRYGITALFRHPQPDPPPPRLQHHLQGIEDCEQLPQRVSPPAQGLLAASTTRNQVRRRRTHKPQQTATEVNVETLRTAEHHDADDADAQLGDTQQSLSSDSESDSEELLPSPAELTGASANANTAQSKSKSSDPQGPQPLAEQVVGNRKQLTEEASKLKKASKLPAEEQPALTGIQVTFF